MKTYEPPFMSIVAHVQKIAIYRHTTCENVALKDIYSTKNETFDFHGTVLLDPVKMSQQKLNQNVYKTSDTQKVVIILFLSSYLEDLLNLMCTQLFPLSSGS